MWLRWGPLAPTQMPGLETELDGAGAQTTGGAPPTLRAGEVKPVPLREPGIQKTADAPPPTPANEVRPVEAMGSHSLLASCSCWPKLAETRYLSHAIVRRAQASPWTWGVGELTRDTCWKCSSLFNSLQERAEEDTLE